jgi:hypothetical protein
MTLAYRVSANVPGETGRGLDPGSCAWVNRTGMAREPGRVDFATAGNAQLKQMQSGGTVDRSATAAERWPDVRSIPEYLKDPAHYWTFSVMSRDPDSALTNGPWMRDLAGVVTGTRTTATSTTRSQPTTVPGGGPFQPGGAGSTSVATTIFDIRNVSVTPGLDGVAIKFEAATGSNPTVDLVTIAGVATPITVSGTPIGGGMSRYAAASQTKLPRNTNYKYVIAASATAQARANQKSGAFKTLGQRVTIAFSQIYVISDGDVSDSEDKGTPFADDEGDLSFQMSACPTRLLAGADAKESNSSNLNWSEGPHAVDAQMTSMSDTIPDRFRVLILGVERDSFGGLSDFPDYFCSKPGYDIPPGRNGSGEWNSIARDIDLTAYPGTKAAAPFAWRSKPLRDGSKLMFEVRGTILVTRQ